MTIGCFGLLAATLSGQKYNFRNLAVEDGLVQSQAMYICQDSSRRLWIATLGGLSRYDGHSFTPFSRTEGLADNTVEIVYCDRRGRILAGTRRGLSIFNGRAFQNYYPGQEAADNFVHDIAEDAQGRLYIAASSRLYRFNGDGFTPISLTGAERDGITCLDRDREGHLWLAARHEGIYRQDSDGQWQCIVAPTTEGRPLVIRQFLFTKAGDTLLATNQGILRLTAGQLRPYGPPELADVIIYHLEEDHQGSLWMASGTGAYRLRGNRLQHFQYAQGLTDNAVHHVFRDVEGNIWLAADEDGIFKFSHLPITLYDEATGLKDPSVMGIVRIGPTIYLTTRNEGLFKLEDGKISDLDLGPAVQRTNSLSPAPNGGLWIGSLGHGLWHYQPGGQMKQVMLGDTMMSLTVNKVYVDDEGVCWVASGRGLFSGKMGQEKFAKKADLFINSLEPYGPDTLLLATGDGAFLYAKRSGNYQALPYPPLQNALLVCTARQDDTYFLGTADYGLFMFRKGGGSLRNLTRADGLPSNFIYNLLAEPRALWIGSGSGISYLEWTDDLSVSRPTNFGTADGLVGLESNHGAAFLDTDGSRWFGLTKSLVHFMPGEPTPNRTVIQPVINLTAVKLFSEPLADSLQQSAASVQLGPRQNHLTFEFNGIYLTDPARLSYAYRLTGLEKDFTFTKNNYVVFSALPPGDYRFEAYAVVNDSLVSANLISYPFTVDAPLLQTRWFQVMMVFLLLALGALAQYWRLRARVLQQRKLEAIRNEAFNRLRKRTAEDFHDEMGNKLTRISILSDILRTKLRADQSDVAQLVDQIKDNVAALYRGSKDIIWSLHPQHDNLSTVLERIRDIGRELFSETEIEFLYQEDTPAPELPLTLEYSRNLQMIAKEAFNNILRHAQASRVQLCFRQLPTGIYLLQFIDDGRGFDSRQPPRGNGLKNLRNRAERIGAHLTVNTVPDHGVTITLELNLGQHSSSTKRRSPISDNYSAAVTRNA